MLEPRVVATRPTSSAWLLNLSYESGSLNLEDTIRAPLVQNNTPPISPNRDDIHMESAGIGYSAEGISNKVNEDDEIHMEGIGNKVNEDDEIHMEGIGNKVNGDDEIHMEGIGNKVNVDDEVPMETERTGYIEEGIGNEDAPKHHGDAPINDEFLQLARAFESLGRDRVQELVLLKESTTFLYSELT
jgi:hypothetical protein